MDFLIDLGTLLLIWLLVSATAIFVVGAAMTQRALYRSQKDTTKSPRVQPGEVVVFEDVNGRRKAYVIQNEKFDGSRRYIVMQDQQSWGHDQRESEIPI